MFVLTLSKNYVCEILILNAYNILVNLKVQKKNHTKNSSIVL